MKYFFSRPLGLLALLSCATTVSGVQAPTGGEALLAEMRSQSGATIQQVVDSNTAYTLLRSRTARPLVADATGRAPLVRARDFLQRYGSLLGVRDAQTELSLQRVSHDRAGNEHVHLSQLHAGLPVFGARLVVHMNDSGIQGVSGVFVPDLAALSIQPSISGAQAAQTALAHMRKTYPRAELSVTGSELSVYRSGLLRGVPGSNYLAHAIEVRSTAGDVREQLFIDAQSGALINRINGIHSTLNREIYTPNQDVPAVLTEGSPAAPADIPLSGDTSSDPVSRAPRAPTDNLYLFAGGTYQLYENLFGREGYDDGATPAAEQVQKSVYLINDVCPNAYWNGDSTNYCPGFDADDIVSHEWSHAYTSFTHGLIYQYQSGALNESYSDIFGEMYDLVNGLEGPLGVTLTEGEYYENGGSRWVLGEDLSEVAAGILLRDMWDPDNFQPYVPLTGVPIQQTFYPTRSPGSVITSPNYHCGSDDGGGVHTNSGVPNHAFAMLVDGKSFNDIDIPAIGMTRAAHIYFHAMVNYQTPTTNFAQHADAIEQSCQDLQGVALNDVLGNASPDVIDATTCAAVAAAMLAVEMRQNPAEKCNYQPLLQPEISTPASCPSGQSEVAVFFEDWESGSIPAGWEVSENITGDTSEDVNWAVTAELPAPHEGHAVFMPNTFGGSCAPGGDISASFLLDSPPITVPENGLLRFSHLMQSEFSFDGGNLKYSLNGADFALVEATAFRHNSYNTTLESGSSLPAPDPVGLFGGGNTNPIAGEAAWSGSDEGESASGWGQSIVDLAALGASAGDTLQFRFEFGQDGCNGNLGWYVDEFTVAQCAVEATEREAVVAEDRGIGASSRGGALGLILLPLLLLGRRRRGG